MEDLSDDLFPPTNPNRVPPTPDVGVSEGDVCWHRHLGWCYVHRIDTRFIKPGMYVKIHTYKDDEIHVERGTVEYMRRTLKKNREIRFSPEAHHERARAALTKI